MAQNDCTGQLEASWSCVYRVVSALGKLPGKQVRSIARERDVRIWVPEEHPWRRGVFHLCICGSLRVEDGVLGGWGLEG